MKKSVVSNLLRQLHIIYFSDWIRFYFEYLKNYKINSSFRKKNPHINLPSDYLIYESFQLNYNKYFYGGFDTAKWLYNHLNKHYNLTNSKILDWGCGPGRIIRHLPDLIDNNCTYYGTDYNKKSINWCNNNLSGISFNLNFLDAKLPYKNNFFDVIYGISIFTHLSEKMHKDWVLELSRILKPGGLLFITTQGDAFKVKLTKNELKKYKNHELIVRGKVKEGHRTFSTFHPKKYTETLFKKFHILEHIERKIQKSFIPQDVWILKK